MVVKDHVDTSVVMNEMIRRSEDSIRRIRFIEESLRSLDTKFDNVESSMLSKSNELKEFLGYNRKDLESLNKRLLIIENDISNIKKALSKFVKKAEIVELQSYLDLMSPIKSDFATKSEVRDMIKRAG